MRKENTNTKEYKIMLYQYLDYEYDEGEDEDEDDKENENIIDELYNSLLVLKTQTEKELKELEEKLQTDEELNNQALEIMINKKLDTYIDNYILECTPLGNIYMRYNNDKKSFEYFSDHSIPYRYLEVVGRRYVMTYWCKPLFVDLEEELKRAEEKYEEEKRKLEEEKKRAEMFPKQNNTKDVIARLKNYNKDIVNTSQSKLLTKNRPQQNFVLPPQIKANLPNVNTKSEKLLLKERANRYTWEGRMPNFNPLKRIDKKIFDKKLNMSFADFKKMQSKK